MTLRGIAHRAFLFSAIVCAAGSSSPPAQAQSRQTRVFTPGTDDLPSRHGTGALHERFVIPLPPRGCLYHAVFPGTKTGEEDSVTRLDLHAYERCVEKRAALVTFSNEWYRSRRFPEQTCRWIREEGAIPYIRLMLRSDSDLRHAEPVYTLRRIIRGDFDGDLRSWARAAAAFAHPIVVEYGTEVNGDWFSWSAPWNDGGAASFRLAYRHIIRVMREEGAENITWAFHANAVDAPGGTSDRLEEYYPGDNWIDWIALSVYGAQTPMDGDWPSFDTLMDSVYPRLTRLAPGKPIVIAEFGVTSGNKRGSQAAWADRALSGISAQRWPGLIAFSWWNSAWSNDRYAKHDSDMRVQDNPDLCRVFRSRVGQNPLILGSVFTAGGRGPSPE